MSLHADPHTFDSPRWTFMRAITSLDQAMEAEGFSWIYSSDYAETEILVVNDRDRPEVPTTWRGFGVRQVRMRDMSHRQFDPPPTSRRTR